MPKTIDNDIQFIDRSFGFETAFSAAVDVIRSAHVEATGARNGIGLVKLMGRHSGFIACQAAIASTDVDVVLIPEVPVRLEGEHGLLEYLERRARRATATRSSWSPKAPARSCCAQAAGAHRRIRAATRKLGDIGAVLKDRIVEHFRAREPRSTLKYLDPSYHIRSVPASPTDSVYCWNMARNAVHAAMAGNTGC